jgi:ribosome biogenesis GTPase
MSDQPVLKALVLRGSRNVFTVVPDTPLTQNDAANNSLSGSTFDPVECRIKGKVLKGIEDNYNPLAPGDRVRIEPDPLNPGTALITALEERRNVLSRFNQKGQKSQAIAANIDFALCMTTPLSPPFRPRFLDRLLVQAEVSGIAPVILCNKWDLFDGEAAVEERLSDYRRIGYSILRISVKTGAGLDELHALMAGKTSALLGQSGVGKSSLLNALSPGLSVKTGAVNEKYDRGNHTTAQSVMLMLPGFVEPTFLIDTPGIRRMVPDGVKAEDLALYMKEFAGYAGRCAYGLSCSHRGEPGCKILEAAAQGLIHEDRYESFLRIGDELAAL